ncbi:COR domain-containing protein [Catellatospora sp. IY07-71]|uniref:COR domain-containing protein n=1 Tax=Catellatospora sp. IY07-71 TaxID=2728827 RepID=UPI001BB42686|nr:COR domain-containing protein [Catellatospora sp. IY07-71]
MRVLELYGNRLEYLPDEIWSLGQLEELDLNDNLLRDLPSGIAKLKKLRVLDISNNPIRRLPPELADMVKRGLRLIAEGTRFHDGVNSSGSLGTAGTSAYLRSLNDAIQLHEAKVVLVGEGNVGKTSLVAALNEKPFVHNRSTTHGIEVNQLRLASPDDSDIQLTLHMWDFGGQEVYRITHQFFFSQRALYLVVWNPREGQEQNEVEGWLRRIRLRVGPDAPTMIVATHGEERRAELDYPRLMHMFPGMLRGHFVVDSRTGYGVQQLRGKLAEHASRLPQMGQALSRRWVTAREEVRSIARRHPYIKYQRFVNICRGNELPDDEITALANLLHDLGVIIYYSDDDGLRDVVVLDPEWLTKAIGAVLEDEHTRNEMGVLDHSRLRDIWSDRPNGLSYPTQFHPYFLRLMEKFDVSYRLAEDEHRSLIAQLVPYERPLLTWESTTPLANNVYVLRLICELAEPAPGLIAWLTVRHHLASTRRHWRAGVFLRHPIALYESEALLELTSSERHLLIEVRAPSPDMFFNVLRDSVEDLIRRRWPGLTYRLHVPCPTKFAGGNRCDGQFPLEGLLGYRQRGGHSYPCLNCQTDHDVTLLLTGFATPKLGLHSRLDQLAIDLTDVRSGVERLELQAVEASRQAADASDLLRRLLKATSIEVADCPRLFTLAPLSTPALRRLAGRHTLRMTLWCEQAGAHHALSDAVYEFEKPTRWLAKVGPYISLTFRVLKAGAPIAGAVLGVMFDEDRLKSIQHEIDLMKTLIERLPASIADQQQPLTDDGQEVLTRAEGEAARAIRALLQGLDPVQRFGGLRRVQAPSGDYLWVCSMHYREYDAGLPFVP